MALTDLKKNFAPKATALGLSALIALSAATGLADDARPVVTSQQSAPASEFVLAATKEVQGWKAAEQARDYGRTGNVGILIYRGDDAGPYSGEDIARIFEAAFAKKNVTARAFYDEARSGGTSISYALGKDGWGPFNTTEAIQQIDMIAGEYKVRRLVGEAPIEDPLVAQQ